MSHRGKPVDECAFCELVKLLYPHYKADNSKAALLILSHLEMAHHIGIPADPAPR